MLKKDQARPIPRKRINQCTLTADVSIERCHLRHDATTAFACEPQRNTTNMTNRINNKKTHKKRSAIIQNARQRTLSMTASTIMKGGGEEKSENNNRISGGGESARGR